VSRLLDGVPPGDDGVDGGQQVLGLGLGQEADMAEVDPEYRRASGTGQLGAAQDRPVPAEHDDELAARRVGLVLGDPDVEFAIVGTQVGGLVRAEHDLDAGRREQPDRLGGHPQRLVAAAVDDHPDGATAHARVPTAARIAAASASDAPAANQQKTSMLPFAPGRTDATTPRVPSPSAARGARDAFDGGGAQCRVPDDTAGAELLAADLELRLDHQQEVRGRGRECAQHGQHHGEGDEGEVGDHDVGRGAEAAGEHGSHVRLLVHLDPWVTAQFGGQLSGAHVYGDNGGGAVFEQDLREPAGGRPRVETATSGDAQAGRPKGLDRAQELQRAAAHVVVVLAVLDGDRRRVGHRQGRLARRNTGHQHAALADQPGGHLSGACDTTPHELGIEAAMPGSLTHVRRRDRRCRCRCRCR